MEKVFLVELRGPETESEACGNIFLPASSHDLRDIMNRLRLSESAEQDTGLTLFVEESDPAVEFLLVHMQKGIRSLNTFFLLNTLARSLVQMDAARLCAFAGLVGMEMAHGMKRIPVARLCELTDEVDECHVISGISDDASLGRFYLRHGFLPEYAGLPETALAYLDYAAIGRERRERDGGVFLTDGGYVIREAESTQTCKDFMSKETPCVMAEDFAVVLEWPVPPPNLQGARKTGGLPGGPDMLLYCGEGSLPCLCVAPEEILRMADGGGLSRKDAMPLREGLATALKMAAVKHDGRHPVFVRQVAT